MEQQKSGCPPREGTPILPRCVGLEKDFHRQLSDAGIPRLSGPKGAKGAAIEFVEGGDLVSAIYSACADAFRRERRVV